MRINYSYVLIIGSILIISISAIYHVIKQNKEVDQAVAKAVFTVGSCYRMNSDSSDHAIKITSVVGKNAYVEKTWTKDRGWDNEAISERTAYFYSEIKCPN